MPKTLVYDINFKHIGAVPALFGRVTYRLPYKGKLRYLKTERKRHLSLIEEQETERDVIENLKNKEKNKKEFSDAERLIKNNKHPTLF